MLTKEKFERIAGDAREDLRDVLHLIAIHEERLAAGRRAAFLNSPTVLVAAAAWERFITDLVGASVMEDWSRPGDWDKGVAWPGTTRNQDGTRRLDPKLLEQRLDARLTDSGVLDGALTASWRARVATSWFGKTPTEWYFLDYSSAVREQAETLQSLMLSAKTARDAAGHGLLDKKAVDAGESYWWMSDNHGRLRADGSEGGPTIQSGYARGVAALFVQLIDCSIAAVADRNGWGPGGRLPADWFRSAPRSGKTLRGVRLWGGEVLHRVD